MLYINVKDAYRALSLPPLGRPNRDLVFLQTRYKPHVKRQFAKKKKPSQSGNGHLMPLNLLGTALNVQIGVCCWKQMRTVWILTDRLIVSLSTSTYVETQLYLQGLYGVCTMQNPWMTSNIKAIPNQKKVAFREGDKELLKQVQHELNIHELLRGINTISDYNKKKRHPLMSDVKRAGELNQFFSLLMWKLLPLPHLSVTKIGVR